MPPLRERRDDIPLLARELLGRHARASGRRSPVLEDDALDKLRAYDWPGNVRELDNVMERAVVLCTDESISASLLADLSVADASDSTGGRAAAEGFALTPQVEALERQIITEALAAAGDNKARAARLLEISERSLWYKLKKYGLT